MRKLWKVIFACLLAGVGVGLAMRSCARSSGRISRQFSQSEVKPGDRTYSAAADLLAESARQEADDLAGWVAARMSADSAEDDRNGVVACIGKIRSASRYRIESISHYGSQLVKVVIALEDKEGTSEKVALILSHDDGRLRFHCVP